jgi:uncharacterized membrane-anchored protein
MRRILVLIIAVLILGTINVAIYQQEQLLVSGTTLLLELVPVDPRSLIQGDYMALRYKIADEASHQVTKTRATDGYLVVIRDNNQQARFKEIYDGKTPLKAREYLLRFRKRGEQIRLGAESFFFQEGQARYYGQARYGELRVTPTGESILVGLRDKAFKPLDDPVARTSTGK